MFFLSRKSLLLPSLSLSEENNRSYFYDDHCFTKLIALANPHFVLPIAQILTPLSVPRRGRMMGGCERDSMPCLPPNRRHIARLRMLMLHFPQYAHTLPYTLLFCPPARILILQTDVAAACLHLG